MAHPIVEISGLDYTGKTTQAEMLTYETQGRHVHNFGSFSTYGDAIPAHLNPQELFNWWFVDSSPDDISNALLTAYNARQYIAGTADLDLAVVERGQTMLRAQIAATYATRASVEVVDCVEQADAIVDAGTTRTTQAPHELILVPDEKWQSHRDRLAAYTRTPVKEGVHFTPAQNEYYAQYTNNVRTALGHYALHTSAEIVSVDRPAVDMQNGLRQHSILEDLRLPDLFNEDSLFIGLAGLSESGKSAIAARLAEQHSFTRLKIGYFNESLRKVEQLQANPEQIALHMVHFLATNRHINKATLESLHGPGISSELKLLMGDRWKAVYIELDENERQRRVMAQFPDADPAELLRTQAEKDKRKLAAGIAVYKEIADICLSNSGNIDETVAKLLKETTV